MSFIISGLPSAPFQPYFGLSEEALAAHGIVRRKVDVAPGFPCRVTLEDAPVGESVLLLNYEHQSADTPFRASHAIYVREGDQPTRSTRDAIPSALAAREHISLRAFDAKGMMINAEVARGPDLAPAIERLLGAPETAYLHAHYAAMGCYAARIDRA